MGVPGANRPWLRECCAPLRGTAVVLQAWPVARPAPLPALSLKFAEPAGWGSAQPLAVSPARWLTDSSASARGAVRPRARPLW
jgi:hypothetical protein